ncbi:hypothetical protein ACFSUS_28020 [Spirosoma soli]|uniref:Helix-turn-helix domain-containing protein n=1 Tax=Spirosoma soli TaxID=1770529 RepID=A0ABW5MBY6_9BACT
MSTIIGNGARDLKKSPPGGPVEYFQPTDLRLYYEFIQALANTFTVETLCSVLEVSRTAYYRYRRGELQTNG